MQKCIDLTHALSSHIPTWSGCCGFETTTVLDYHECTSLTKFRVQTLSMNAGIGTHLDAPVHCVHGGRTVADLTLSELYVPAVVIDVSAQAHADYKVSVADILTFEEQWGIIPAGSLVIIFTGWGRLWSEPEKYRNNYQFPTVSQEAAQFLLDRGVVGLGIDTLSPDNDKEFPVHQLFLGYDKYLIENVAHADQLPPVGAHVITLPLKIEGGTESPVRMIAFLSNPV